MQFNLTPTGSDYSTLEDLPPTFGQSAMSGVRSVVRESPIIGLGWEQGKRLLADGPRLDSAGASSLAQEYGKDVLPVEPGMYTEATARSNYQRQVEKHTDETIAAGTPWPWQTGGSVAGTGARGVLNGLVSLADPLNLAAMFVPVGRVGATLAERSLAAEATIGRVGWRAAEGALQGALGMGIIEGASVPLRRDLGEATDPLESVANIGMGAVLGGALHGLGGLAKAKPEEVPPSVAAQSPEVRAAAEQTAVGQILQDHPVDVDHITDATPTDIASVEQARNAIAANRERSIFDGDGKPPREEPAPAATEGATVSPEVADAQTKATEATQRAQTAIEGAREAGIEPRAPELQAADEVVARAGREADAYDAVANCLRLQ